MQRYHSPARRPALNHELRGLRSFSCHSWKHHQPAELAQKGGQLLFLSSLIISKCRNKGVGQYLGSFQSHRLSREQAKTAQGWQTEPCVYTGRIPTQVTMVIRASCVVAAVVRSLSRVWPFATPWTAARQASLSFTISMSLLQLMSIESAMPSNHLILCRPLLLLPSIFPSIRVFSNESALLIRWPKYWSFSFSNTPSNEYPGLISFRPDSLERLDSHPSHDSSQSQLDNR